MEKLKCSECDNELEKTFEDKDIKLYLCKNCGEDFIVFKSTGKMERLVSEKDL